MASVLFDEKGGQGFLQSRLAKRLVRSQKALGLAKMGEAVGRRLREEEEQGDDRMEARGMDMGPR